MLFRSKPFFILLIKFKKMKKGFTLIELLVVIAIIGILSSVVLASLNSARSKGADASIKGNISGIRATAELVYDSVSPNSYSTVVLLLLPLMRLQLL